MCRKKQVVVLAPLFVAFLSVIFFSGSCENIPEEVVWHGIKAIAYLGDGNPNDASVAISGDNVYISYNNRGALNVAKSSDGGAMWKLMPVDLNPEVAWGNSITALESNIYVSHESFGDGKLKFAKSTDGSETWSVYTGEIDVGYNTNVQGTSIAAEGSSVFIGYYLKFAKGTKGPLDTAPFGYIWKDIAISGNNVYISYFTNDMKLIKSTDSGATWPSENITFVDTDGDIGRNNAIAAEGNVVYLVYFNQETDELMFAKSIDNGETW